MSQLSHAGHREVNSSLYVVRVRPVCRKNRAEIAKQERVLENLSFAFDFWLRALCGFELLVSDPLVSTRPCKLLLVFRLGDAVLLVDSETEGALAWLVAPRASHPAPSVVAKIIS